jgi:predicted metal-binding transcription factor (methanogenesis marker protein 9)
MLNFNCVFPDCTFKRNDISEEDFLQHLSKVHHEEMMDSSKKEKISLKTVEMMTVSNSKVFINSG